MDEDGENISTEDLADYLENFNKIYVNNNTDPDEYKSYEYECDGEVLKMKCNVHKNGKEEHLYNSSMSFEIVDSIVRNSQILKEK